MPEKETEKGGVPGPKRRWLSAILPATPQGWAAVMTAVFLLCVVAIVWTVFFLDPNNVPWRHAMGIGRILLVILLVVAIPVVFYLALRLWLDGEKSLYPEIDNAWAAGILALEEQGLDIRDLAFYLIIGSRGTGQERAIMQTGQLDLRVDGVPEGPAPLHWYATPDSVYLFCSDASWSSALAAKRQRHYEEFGDQSVTRRGAVQKSSAMRPVSTPMPSSSALSQPVRPVSPAAASGGGRPGTGRPGSGGPGSGGAGPEPKYLGTVQLDQFLTPETMAQSGPAPVPAGNDLRGTVRLDGGVQTADSPAFSEESEAVFSDTGSERKPISINSKEATLRVGRLTYLCQKITTAREAICPINGILSLLPYAAIDGGTGDAEALQQAVKSDLTTIHYILQIRCPVTALVVDMERQTGFRELMRRVGRDRVSAQRFGRKYDCRSLATEAEMDALSDHVCGSFEDWVYALFREDEALTRPGNQRLYQLLCKVRCTLKTRLAELLQEAFAYDPQQCSVEDGLLFSGCYFAATGERSDHRAFVGGILAKLDDEQELVEWTSDALLSQQRWERLATAGVVCSIVLAGVLVWLVAW